MKLRSTAARGERGQVLVIVALGLVVIVAMVGLVIDGGFAWGQQRKTQNGADSMAEAGAAVLAENLAGVSPVKTDGDVGCAVEAAAEANGVINPTAFYTDINGDFLVPSAQVGPCNPGGNGLVPTTAAGVKAGGDRVFETFLARVIGFNTMKASANATAVTGILTEVCPADAGCAVLPVTFPFTAVQCDGTNKQIQIGTEDWPLATLDDPTHPSYADTDTEVIVPLCTTGPGSVGWLDFGGECGNLAQTIEEPCNVSLPIPDWLHTQTGNINALEDEINEFAGPQVGVADDSIVLIPINTNTCNTDPGEDSNGDAIVNCPGGDGTGNGDNFYYYVKTFAGFMIDQVYIGGSDDECQEAPGAPVAEGNGATGCFKGWFIRYVINGPVGSGASGPQDPSVIGIQLIR
jgi:hypothetical protein